MAAVLRPLGDCPRAQSRVNRSEGSVGLVRVTCFTPTDSLVNRGGLTRRPVYSAGFLDKSIRLENNVDKTVTISGDTHRRRRRAGNHVQARRGGFWGVLGLFNTRSNLARDRGSQVVRRVFRATLYLVCHPVASEL